MLLRCIALIAALGVFGVAYADSDLPDADDLAQSAASRFPQPVRVGDLVGRWVIEPRESQPTLGWVRDVVKERDGTIVVVVNYGGFWGFFSRPIAVPVNGMALVGQVMEVVDYDPEQLDKFPGFNPTSTTPLQPNAVIRVGLAKPSH